MPKIKKSVANEMAEIVQRNIRTAGAMNDCFTCREYEKVVGISDSCVSVKSRNPRTWTLEQLIQISLSFKVSLDWLMKDHRGELK